MKLNTINWKTSHPVHSRFSSISTLVTGCCVDYPESLLSLLSKYLHVTHLDFSLDVSSQAASCMDLNSGDLLSRPGHRLCSEKDPRVYLQCKPPNVSVCFHVIQRVLDVMLTVALWKITRGISFVSCCEKKTLDIHQYTVFLYCFHEPLA